jgi:hypothetical protein
MAMVLKRFLRRAVLVLVSIAFIGAGALASASPVPMAGEPCPHEHGLMHEHQQPKPHSLDPGAAGCLSCCLAACIGVPNLPPQTIAAPTPFRVTQIVYSRAQLPLAGRSIRPEPAPPRPVA